MADEIVQLNVGGTPYQVSRKLMEADPDTMLARLVSERWQKDPEKELFIDRNGERFRYVLDYLRDKEVHLPLGVSSRAVMKDLDYFGFENVTTVHSGRTSVAAVEEVFKTKQQHQKRKRYLEDQIASSEDQIRKLRTELKYDEIAFDYFNSYSQNGKLQEISPIHVTGKSYSFLNETRLDKALAKFGLKAIYTSGKYKRRLCLLDDNASNHDEKKL